MTTHRNNKIQPLRHFAVGVLLMTASVSSLLADGKIVGRVTGPDGAPLPDIHIVLVPQQAGKGRLTSKTNKKGDYFFGLVNRGRYTIETEGTTLAVYSIKLSVFDKEKHKESQGFQGAPPATPVAFDVDIDLEVTYDLVIGDPEQSPAARARRAEAARAAAVQIPALLTSGDYDGAIARADEALATKSDDSQLHYYRGYALFRKKDFAHAKDSIQRALELNSSQVGAHFLMGGILSELGQKADAIGEFEKEIAGKTDQVGLINSYINLGLIHRELGHREKAIEAFEKVVELDPKQAEAYSYLSDLYLASGKPEKAAEVQAKSRGLGLEDPKSAFNIGANYWNNKDFVKAEAAFRHAVELDPKFGLAWKSLGYALVNLGKTTEAADALGKYLELTPKAEDAKDVREMIDAIRTSH
jgi:tetratricopeptide (TPR) repeat protein